MTLRLLLDENMPREAVEALRADGHDVRWMVEEAPGLPDLGVLAMASADNRVLVTADKDFGDIAFASGLPADGGIVLVRVPPMLSKLVASLVMEFLRRAPPLAGQFVVLASDGTFRKRSIDPPSRT